VELEEATKARRNCGVQESHLRELEERSDRRAAESQQLQAEQQEMAQASKAVQVLQQALHQREVEHRTFELEEHQLQAAAMKLSMLQAAREGEEAHHKMAEAACAEERRLEEHFSSQKALQESAVEQLNTEVEELVARRRRLREKGESRQNLYWEAAPFLTVGEEKLWRQRKELKSCHRDISRLQEEVSRSEVRERARRSAAENVAESEQQAHDCEKARREQSLRELLSLQRLSSEVDETWPTIDCPEAGQNSEMDDLQETNLRLQEQVASLKALAERFQPTASESFADVLWGAGNRVISQMKEALRTDLALTEQLQVTKKELEDRCDRERRLRAELEERLNEPREADVSATIAEFLRAEPRTPWNSESRA
ncbi:unnamed protein product, partial [Symbiodinium microadriaticum]